MAVRKEDLRHDGGARVYAFPVVAVRRAAARDAMLARRRRSAGVAGALLVAALLWSMQGGPALSRPGAPHAVQVHSGQTPWDLARRYAAEGADPRAFVDALSQLNGIAGPLETGMVVRLPR